MMDKILESCKYVMKNSEHVKINYNILDSFIEKINCKELKHWLSNNPCDLLQLGISNIINFLLLFESINYSFWGQPKWTVDTDLGSKDGSDALLYILLKYVKKTNSVNFSNMSLEEFKELLKGNVEIPLLKDRYDTLVEISNIVNNKMNGNFYEYTKGITVDTELFQIIIDNFPSFKDEREYKGKTIYFYKLAQLLTSDILHLRELLEGVNVDCSHLSGCADYKIPQTMRALGIIEYDEKLSKIIDNKIEIDISSSYETEIRASMMVVINYVKNKLENVNAIDINDYFFVSSRKVKDEIKPYHLCRNKNY